MVQLGFIRLITLSGQGAPQFVNIKTTLKELAPYTGTTLALWHNKWCGDKSHGACLVLCRVLAQGGANRLSIFPRERAPPTMLKSTKRRLEHFVAPILNSVEPRGDLDPR